MNESGWTQTQLRRFKELGISVDELPSLFPTEGERNSCFQHAEKLKVQEEKARLTKLLREGQRAPLDQLAETLTKLLVQHGFTKVTTPTIISKAALVRMTVDDQNPLSKQVFWLNDKQCLRPMLAPNLYSLMADFCKIRHRPIRFFEIGSCFRKESDGARHNEEFTMMNLVEMGTPEDERVTRLKELALLITDAAGIEDCRFMNEDSKVYGETLDVITGADDMELASGAIGPHPLDLAWRVSGTWVGLGVGLERLLMNAAGDQTIGKYGKSLSYINGIRLKM